MPDKNRLTYLFQRYLNNNITDPELEELFEYIKKTDSDDNFKKYVTDIYQTTHSNQADEKVDWDTMFSNIVQVSGVEEEKTQEPAKRKFLWRKVAAAVIVLIIGIGAYYYFQLPPTTQEDVVKKGNLQPDIQPGGNKAVLTLANGKKVILDSSQKGTVAGQGNMNIVKVGSGLLTYQAQLKAQSRKHKAENTVQYNTLTTPCGGQYELTLSDGTQVWLNAGSSIRYPIAFHGKERKVEMTGEAYFEVAENAQKPFIVKKAEVEIQVLGTHFNVMAYENQKNLKVTLLEGLVRVASAPPSTSSGTGQSAKRQQLRANSQLLHPGEQAIVDNEKMKTIKDVNVDNVVAWKNGYFAFNNADLKTVMRKLARWYDIKVIYKKGIENASSMQKFSGRIGRDLTLSQILTGLKQTRAHFKIEKNSRTVILQ